MIVLTSIFFMANPLIIDFGQNKNANWFSVNDTVMGGRSQGNVSYS
ncbi:MAG: CIA30 family protein [Roseivirga sp.]|nr:CIA30 family protein [Roseivirga sp.]